MHAVVANPVEVGATPYNIAAMAFHDGIQVSGGLVGITTRLTVDNDAGRSKSDASNPSVIPNGFFEAGINKDWRWGVVFDTPYGQRTDWPAGAFPAFAGPIAPLAPTLSKVELYKVSPMIAGKLSPEAGIGIGVDYYRLRKTQLDTVGLALEGDGDAFGWNVGFLYSAAPWSFGISYRSSADIDIGGDITTLLGSAPARTKLRLPAIAQAGVRLAFSPGMSIELDLEYTRWSRFDVLTIDHESPAFPTPIVNRNDWRNTITYRLGWTYQWRPDTVFRLGYSYDPSTVPDAHFSARTPDPKSNSFSVGVGHSFGDWQVDVGYMYVHFSKRTFDTDVPFGTYGFDPNGTAVYNGTYKSKAQLFALNVTKRF